MTSETSEEQNIYWRVAYPWPMSHRDYVFLRKSRVLEESDKFPKRWCIIGLMYLLFHSLCMPPYHVFQYCWTLFIDEVNSIIKITENFCIRLNLTGSINI